MLRAFLYDRSKAAARRFADSPDLFRLMVASEEKTG